MATPNPRASAFRENVASALVLARADLIYMLSRRETIMWVFVMPVIFFYFIGTVTAGFGGRAPGTRDTIAVRGGQGGGLVMDELVRRLEAQDYTVARPESDEEFARFARQLTIPAPAPPHATITEAVLAGEPQTLRFRRDGDALAAGYDQVRVARAVYEVLADLAVLRIDGVEPTADAFGRLAEAPRALTLSVRSAGRRVEPPSGFAQAVPGTLVMFTMLVLLTSGAVTLVQEREQGLLRRLASTPISPHAVVAGKWMGRMCLALVQIAFAMAAGSVLFQMDWGGSVPMVFLVLFGWAAFTASLAIVLANWAQTAAQTAGVGVLATQVLAALGGCWWPIEIAPAWMQTLALALPTGWTMDALHKLVAFGDGPTSALPHVAALGAGALGLGWIGGRIFRYQ
jgi:ABC-2 type transport system permease protein